MSVATLSVGAGLAIAGGVGAAGSLAGGLIASSGAKSAAQTQANAADYSANLQYQEFLQNQANLQPWLNQGKVSLGQLAAGFDPNAIITNPDGTTSTNPLAGVFLQPNPAGTFAPPTLEQAKQNPGYQFALQQGDLGIEQGQAAAGGAFNTGTLKSLAQYNQNLAETNYQQVYNNALNTYLTQFNAANTNTTNLYNRLAALAGTGQTAANTLGQIGTQSTANIGNTLQAGSAASAAGQIGSASAIANAISGVSNSASGYLTLSQLLGGGGFGAPNTANNPAYSISPGSVYAAPGAPGGGSYPGYTVPDPNTYTGL